MMKSPSRVRVRGIAPVQGLRMQKLKNFQGSVRQILCILRVFNLYKSVCSANNIMATIIPLSLQNGGINVICPPPLACVWGGAVAPRGPRLHCQYAVL